MFQNHSLILHERHKELDQRSDLILDKILKDIFINRDPKKEVSEKIHYQIKLCVVRQPFLSTYHEANQIFVSFTVKTNSSTSKNTKII